MSRKELVVEIVWTTLIRGVLTAMFAFVCIATDYMNTWLRPWGLVVTIFFVGAYIYSVFDEVRLFIEAYHEADH